MRRFILIFTVLALCAIPVVARADLDGTEIIKWVQWPDPFGWDVKVTQPKILADDFPCHEEGWITDVHFWGSWKHGVTGQITGVHLSIHKDLTGAYPSQPGELVWDKDVPGSEIEVVQWPETGDQGWYDPNNPDEWSYPDHQEMWLVNIEFRDKAQWFWQEGMVEDPATPGILVPSIYWLDIQVQVADPINTDFGWKTSMDHWRDDAVWRDEFWDPEAWEKLESPIEPYESLDMAFAITTIPEPGVIVIAGIGLIALLRRRKT